MSVHSVPKFAIPLRFTQIFEHPDEFLPFLPAENDTGLMSRKEFEKYCVMMRDTGAWGGEPEILALSRFYQVPIHVVQGAPPPVVVHNPSESEPPENSPILRISYHRRMYGLGEVHNTTSAHHGDKDSYCSYSTTTLYALSSMA